MEEEKYGFVHDSEVEEVVHRFERMQSKKETCYFDVIEFEAIIDYYLDGNNPVHAFEATSLACELHPNSVPILIRKARVLLEKGRATEALTISKRLENIEPGNCDIYLCKATALAMLGDITGARRVFDLALATDAEDQETILYSITLVLQNLNYHKEMIPYLHMLADLEPDFPAHIYDLAYAYDKKGDHENSVKYYTKYLDEDPYSDSAWYNLGIIYNKTGEYGKSIEAYDYALALNPENTFALFNKANILSNLEKYDEAMDVYREFVAEEPDSMEGLTYLAECYDKTGDEVMARKYYTEAIDITPDFPDPWYGLGLLSLSRNRPSESITPLKKAIEIDPENPDYWFSLGKAYIMMGNIKEAIRSYKETLLLDGYYDEAWIEIGILIMMTGAYKGAIRLLNKVKRISGDLPGIYFLLASSYLHSGNLSEAARALIKAVRLDNELIEEYAVLLPEDKLTNAMKRLFRKTN
ncbi:MAG: tetratricopeptide repeat protein [Bacteroidales bacterium]|jgi:tetratricopeptide (TPR) repeat protein|nr:tetratricopeptide repeat protein [Bacteroidales bacterium]